MTAKEAAAEIAKLRRIQVAAEAIYRRTLAHVANRRREVERLCPHPADLRRSDSPKDAPNFVMDWCEACEAIFSNPEVGQS